jgi:phosphoglycolate phosphatase
MKYDLVAFDFDGTLADTVPWYESVMDSVAEKYNFSKVSKNDREALRRCDSHEVMRYLGIPIWKIPSIVRHVRHLMETTMPDISLFDGATETLVKMDAAGVELAIVSSNSLENVRRVLGGQLSTLIRHFECGVSVFGKAEKLNRLIKKTGISRERMILIGDELRDLQAAKTAKIRAGAVGWGYNCIQVLSQKQPDEVFLNMDELSEKILQLAYSQ